MKSKLRSWQICIVAILTALNSYSIAQGLRYQTFLGVFLAVASLITLGFCIRLFKAMNNADAGVEEDAS